MAAILARLQAIEKDKGMVTPSIPVPPAHPPGRAQTRKKKQDDLLMSLSARLDAIESASNQTQAPESRATGDPDQQTNIPLSTTPPTMDTASNPTPSVSLGIGNSTQTAGEQNTCTTQALPHISGTMPPWSLLPWLTGLSLPSFNAGGTPVNTAQSIAAGLEQLKMATLLSGSGIVEQARPAPSNPPVPINTQSENTLNRNSSNAQTNQQIVNPSTLGNSGNTGGSNIMPTNTVPGTAAVPQDNTAQTVPASAICAAVWQGPAGSSNMNQIGQNLENKDIYAGLERDAVPTGSTPAPLGYHLLPPQETRYGKGIISMFFHCFFENLRAMQMKKGLIKMLKG